jgi:flagellar basal body-associated protein FliL
MRAALPERGMSDKADKKSAPAPEKAPEGGAAPAPAKKKPPIALIAVVAVVMIVEAAVVYVIAGASGPKPAAAQIDEHADKHDEHEQTVEIPLVEERFQNMQSGRAFIWDASIVLKVRAKDEELVTKTVEQRASEIKEGIALIFRRAPHSQLTEPGLETLNAQLTAYLNEVIPHDSDSKPRIQRVMIPRCRGFPAD